MVLNRVARRRMWRGGIQLRRSRDFPFQNALDEGDVLLEPPQACEIKITGFRAARPNTAPPKNTAARSVAG